MVGQCSPSAFDLGQEHRPVGRSSARWKGWRRIHYRCTQPPQTGKTCPTKQLADSLQR
jgi:hypothetical protein